jgi:Permease for cytosine/purines, uracil, thiamine, allantoin
VVWAASNLTYLYIVLGGTMVLLGLNAWQSLAVVAAGNLLWLLLGWLSVSGPSAGTPSEVITRRMYGVRGNRVYNALLGWGVGIVYEAINLSVGALAGFALVGQWGGHASAAVKWAVVLGTALITFTVSVYGHAAIVRFSGWFTWLLLAGFIVLGYYVLEHANWGYQAPVQEAAHGAALWAAAAAGFTIIASAPLSWRSGIAASRCSTTVRHRLSRPRVGRWHPRISSGAGPGSSPPSRPRLAPAGPRIRPLPAEAVEFPVPDAAEKGVPLIRGEPQDRPRGIPAVTNADLAPGQARHLDAVAVGVAQRALDPVRTRTRPFASAAERSACHVTSSLRGLFYLKCATSQPEMRARNTWPYR